MKSRDWIVIYDAKGKPGKPPYSLECLRCKQTVVFGMADGGLNVDFLVAVAKAFGKAHERCKP